MSFFSVHQKGDKQTCLTCKILVGGAHITQLDQLVLKYYPFVDIVVRMEGEESVLEIIKGKDLDKIKGITFRKNGKIIRTPNRPLIKNIDQLYYDYTLNKDLFDWKDGEVPKHLSSKVHLPFISSRGCPFQCKFCASHQQWCNI